MKAPRLPVWILLLLALAAWLVPLPAGLVVFRPPWLTLMLIYWALMWPGRVGIYTAFFFGLLLDVAQGNLLGQHAFVLSLVIFVVLYFHLQMRVYPLWQLTLVVFSLTAVEAFLNLWIDGVVGTAVTGWTRWGPVLATLLFWPLLMGVVDRIRERLERRDAGLL
jgi:rod shape-determining protein MreD